MGRFAGYSIHVGGGFGMSHGKVETYPCLAQPLFYCAAENAAAACEAIVTVQRDHGDRSDRKHARMKYLVAERGIDWFRRKVEERIDFPTEARKRKCSWAAVADTLGWHAQGDGKYFVGVYVSQGRIADTDAEQNPQCLPPNRRRDRLLTCASPQTRTCISTTSSEEDRDRVNAILTVSTGW